VTTLFARILRENRAIIVALGVVLLANLFTYAFLVRPRGVEAEGSADRAARAESARRTAEREEAIAREFVGGKALADEELNAFYEKVLPANLEAARRMTYTSLPALADKSRIRWENRTSEVEPPEKGARLGRLVIRMVLQGDYENLRQFLYRVEGAPEFVIIDDVSLSESKPNEPLTFSIRMSTYYRLDGGSGA
jgi:hypothetical protein